MNEVEYILRIVLKARDELATALKRAREELRLFANAAGDNQKKIDAFNTSVEKMNVNIDNITDKFREWRAVIQGTSDGTEKARKSFGDLAKDVDEAGKATKRSADAAEKHAVAQDKLLKSADKLRNEYRKLHETEGEIDKDREYSVFRLKEIGVQLESISKKVADPKIQRFYFNWARDAKSAANSIIAEQKRITAAEEEEAKKRVDAEEAALKFAEKAEKDSFARRAKAHESAVKTYNNIVARGLQQQIAEEEAAAKESVRIETEKARRKEQINQRESERYRAFVNQRAALQRLTSGDADFIDVGRARETVTEMRKVANQYKDTSKTYRELKDGAIALEHALRGVNRQGDESNHVFSRLFRAFRNNSDSIATLDNQLRGMGLLLVVGFAQQLITVLGGLGGAFVSVASSAAMAGGAIGGIFVAGIVQAIPAIGLLGAALARVKSVMEAVQAAQAADQQNATQAATAHRRVADAADTLREAQERLSKARKDAREEIEDLIDAEREAELAAIGATLSQQEAQEALREAVASGEGVARAQLGVLEANAAKQEAIEDRQDARRKSRQAQRGGVEAMPGVVQANQQLETAKRNAQEAAAGTETAVAKLNYLIAQLSPAERRLYEAVTNFQNLFKQGVYREITDNLVNSFARSVEKITKIIQMPEVLGLAKRTSKTLASTMNNVFDSFTTKPMLDQFVRIGEAGRKNLKPLGGILTDVGKIILNIAEAAGPSFRRFIGFVGDLVGKFLDLTDNRKAMTAFFDEGEKHLEAWIELFVAVIDLFAALTGAGGAESGLKTIEDATKAIDDLAEKVRDNRKDVAKFFEDARDIAYEVVGVLVEIAKALGRTFTPERVHRFADFIKKVIIPALENVIDFLGQITDKLVEFADTPIGGEIIKGLVAFVVLQRILGGVLGSLKLITTFVGPIAEALISVGSSAGAWEKIGQVLLRFGRFGGPIAIAIGLIVLLLDKLGLLDDAWEAVKSGFNEFWKLVQPSLKQFFRSIKQAWEAVRDGKGAFGLILDVLKPIMKVLIDIGGIFFRVFGRFLGRIISGALDILSGFIDVVIGILTGDWSKAWEGAKRIVRGFIRGATAIFRAFPEFIWEIIKKLPGLFRKLVPLIKDAAKAIFHAIVDFLEKLPERMKKLGKTVGEALIDGIVAAIKSGASLAKDLANALIDILNKLLPNKIPIPGAPDIDLPDNPIPHLAEGGPSGKGSSSGFLAVLHPDEHIWTAAEVRAAGGHDAMFAMRRYYGGGGQGRGSYRDGGQATSPSGALTVTFIGEGMEEFTVLWRQFWNVIVLLAIQGTTRVEQQFRDMRAVISRNVNRMYRDVRDALVAMDRSFELRGKRIVESWSDTWLSLMKVTHQGLFYIGHETNQGLRGLGEKSINFGFTEPKKSDGKAGGGWIGMQGQRGQDRGLYPLGDGEAVLNWQHQKYVEPAMNAYYGHGLASMFDRVHGYHAGIGGSGYASGRPPQFSPIPGFPMEEANTRIIPLLVRLMKQYKFIPTDVYDRDRSAGHKSPGHNVTGTALDAVPGPGGSWALIEAMGRWAVGQGMTVGYGAGVPGSQAWPGHGYGNHIHIELGGDPGVAGTVLETVAKVGRPLITGGGKLAEMVQAAFDMVLKAANAELTATFDPVSGTTSFKLGPGGAAQKVFDFFTARGLSDAIAAGFVGTFQKESNFVTTVQNAAGSGATGLAQWLGGRLTALQALPNWTSLATQLNYVWKELHSTESAAFSAIKGASTPEEAAYLIDSRYERSDNILSAPQYARAAYERFHHTGPRKQYAEGGEIPGPLGQAIPILAHAQEWIVNPTQQARLAALTGLSRYGLKSMLGFYGGKGSYQGGGAPGDTEVTRLSDKDVKGIDNARLRRIIVALRNLGTRLDRMAEAIRPAERFVDGLDKTMDNLGRLSHRINRVRDKSDRRTGVRGFLDAMENLTGDTGLFAKLRESIERRTERFGRRLVRDRFTVSGRRGARVVARAQDDVQEARAELAEQQRQRTDLVAERDAQRRALNQVRRQQRRKGLTDLQRRRLQAQENLLQTSLDESRQRIVDNTQSIFDAQQNVADAVAAQQQAIIDAQEKLVESLRDQVDKINAAASRRLGALDLVTRMHDALGTIGLSGVVAAGGTALSRSGVFTARGAALASQRAQLQGVLGRARGQKGAEELIAELEDQINELTVAIAENTKAAFDARIEDVNTRASTALTFNDLNKQLIELDGQIAGNTDQAALLLKSQERQAILVRQGNELSALLAQATPGSQTYQDLQIAVLENTIAQRQNTIATNELTGATASPQTFTSTAWSRFREAIFSGMGQVLPQYNPTNLMGGINTGAQIIPMGGGISSSRISGDTNINLYESGRDPDLNEISAAITFASKTSQ